MRHELAYRAQKACDNSGSVCDNPIGNLELSANNRSADMKKKIGIAAVILIAVVLIAHAYRPPGQIQFLTNGVPCANLKGSYYGLNGPTLSLPATTDQNGVLNISSVPRRTKTALLTLNDANGAPVWSGMISVPERASSVKIDTQSKRSEYVEHGLDLNFGLFSIKTENRRICQQLP
ncbi:hypothetical protein GC197_03230 [bacterium]|nr:hypothetical protein [bacterium]